MIALALIFGAHAAAAGLARYGYQWSGRQFAQEAARQASR